MKEAIGKLVSAIIVTHNRAELLPRAIQSVINQTYKNLEIIIVDDGSRDNTGEVVHTSQEKHPQIRFLRNEVSKGACAARNYGIREATGEFVAGLDDDDEWLPERIELLIENYSDDFSFVCSRDKVVYKDREEYRDFFPLITFDDMLFKNVAGNQVFTKKERILAVGGFDESTKSGQDYDLWLRLIRKYGNAKMIPIPLQTIYRDGDVERITKSKHKVSGDWKIYKKYKYSMSKSQRRVRLLNFKRIKNKRIRLVELLRIWNTRYFFFFLHYYLKSKKEI